MHFLFPHFLTRLFLQLILDEKKHSDRSGGGAAEPSAAGLSKRVRAAAVVEDKENFDGDE